MTKLYIDFLAMGITLFYTVVMLDANDRMDCIKIIKKNSVPLSPMPTGRNFQKNLIGEIKACIFDVYGTLFLSATGDIGILKQLQKRSHFTGAFEAAGIENSTKDFGELAERLFYREIEKEHMILKNRGIDFPEVQILQIWDRVCTALQDEGAIFAKPAGSQIMRLAVEYETRVNPVWPIDGLPQLLKSLAEKSIATGIVSNAQFYTPLLFPALLNAELKELEIHEDFCIWSWEHSAGKPSTRLFPPLLQRLKKRFGIQPEQVLYIGNDMLKDIYTARNAGCKTCLFAGDQRSLRERNNHPSCINLIPDAIVVKLDQILCVIG